MSAAETAITEKNNSNLNSPQKPEKRKWFADVFVIVFCVSGAVFSLNLFRLDLFQSIAIQNKKPMGTVTVKYNNVQRRFSDRVLWSRLTVKSPIYLGDLIRVAEYSSATLNINDGIIDINENSLIRIRASQDGEDRVVIDLNSGSLSITGSDTADSTVALSVMGRVIAPAAKATLSASAGESGVKLQVNEGSVIITGEDGQSRSMEAGEAIFLDTKGVEQAAPAAVVLLPRPNARFIKNSAEPVNIRFTWNVINIDQQQPLRLEIASGPNFTHIVRTTEGINSSNAALDAGIWYWRLSYQDTVLSFGQFTIADAVMSAPISPIKDSQFSYQENMPVRFEWQPVEGASYYILEAGLTPDIMNPLITRQTAIASFVESNMEAGNWYWHVKPVFSSMYEGAASFSQVSSFKIDKPVAAVQAANEPSAAPLPDDSISDPNVNTFSEVEWVTYDDKISKSNINIAKEIIDGKEREVLTINVNLASGNSQWAGAGTGAGTENIKFIQKLKNADGVRFKALGDGKKWRVYFAASNVTDGAYHGLTISTKKGAVGNYDIPFNKLNQPDWSQRKVRFIKNNIKWMNIESNREISNAGASSIKIFDLEVYQNSNEPSATPAPPENKSTPAAVPASENPVTPPAPETEASADPASNSNLFISPTAGWYVSKDSSSISNFNIARETIDGKERDVLTINVNLRGMGTGNNNYAGAALTTNKDVLQKLRNANGVRFKVLGDGKKWNARFVTSDVTNFANHLSAISTINNKVSNIDISFDKLRQPNWNNQPVRYIKNNLNELIIERNVNDEAGSLGAASIKIFDFEVY